MDSYRRAADFLNFNNAEVLCVQHEFGISYHPDHLGRILHDLGFSPQKPQQRARERDEEAIARWRKQDWPRIKKGDDGAKLPSCFSMKQAFFCNV